MAGPVKLELENVPDQKAENQGERYWMCIIGPVDKAAVPEGADFIMRRAVGQAFGVVTGRWEGVREWSGWGLTKERMEEIQKVWHKE